MEVYVLFWSGVQDYDHQERMIGIFSSQARAETEKQRRLNENIDWPGVYGDVAEYKIKKFVMDTVVEE
jgi:hypothetical protein